VEPEISTPLPGSQAEIVPATWHDFSAVRALEKICFPVDVWPFWDVFGVLALPSILRFKAVLEGQLVGFIAVDIRARKNEAWISTLGVLPAFRRRGIATKLIETCECRVDVAYIRLCVRASNRGAIQLYERLGYKKYAQWRRYYRGGETAVVMQKKLSKGY
jgi:ribosomal-protein-alanine N-acetyltransferase